jgi:hypothetical protein
LLYSLDICDFTGQRKPRIMHLCTVERLLFMGDPAIDLKNNPLAIEGLEHVLESDDLTVSDNVKIANEQMSDTVGQVIGEKVSITEAAIRLGVSERTIQRRITRGQLTTEKDAAGRVHVICPTHPDTLTVNVGQPANTDGQLSDTVGHNEGTSDHDQLWDMVRGQAAKIEALTARNGWLESQLHERESDIKELKLLTDSQHKRGFWARFGSWFMTGR